MKIYLNSIINENRYFVHYKVAANILNKIYFLAKGFKTYRMESYNEKYFDDTLEFSVGHGSTHPHQLHFEILSELGIIGYISCYLKFNFLIYKQSSLKKFFNKRKYIISYLHLYFHCYLLEVSLQVLLQQFFL